MSKPGNKNCILIAAGGTGGHLFPALSLKEGLVNNGYKVIIATDARGVARMESYGDNTECYVFPTGAVVGKSLFKKLTSILSILKGVLAARSVLKKEQVQMVIGMGGYPSVGPIMAGKICRIPLLVHEGNAVLGKANLLAVNVGAKLAASLPIKNIPKKLTKRTPPYTLTGMPLKNEIIDIAKILYSPIIDKGPIQLLIWGGSLGSESLSILIAKSLSLLPQPLRARLQILQQVPDTKKDSISDIYKSAGIKKPTLVPFIKDVAKALASASLVIGRSGGATVAELQAAQRPAICFPLPSSAYGEQKANASIFDSLGYGWMLDENTTTPESFSEFLKELLLNPTEITKRYKKLSNSSCNNATQELVKLIGLTTKK